ncbi:MAG TPA: hypothetical protein PLA71_00975 [Saccharofermentans sp.]|nr:hypothetical protein [Saccharofermentans sp.]
MATKHYRSDFKENLNRDQRDTVSNYESRISNDSELKKEYEALSVDEKTNLMDREICLSRMKGLLDNAELIDYDKEQFRLTSLMIMAGWQKRAIDEIHELAIIKSNWSRDSYVRDRLECAGIQPFKTRSR